jgi:hypothetical protein
MSPTDIFARSPFGQAVGPPSCCCAQTETAIRRSLGAVVHEYRFTSGA